MSIVQYFINIWIFCKAFKDILLTLSYVTLLSSIPILIPGQVSNGAYILLLMTGLWVMETIPIYVTALIPVFLGPLFGIVSATNISTAYMTNTNMLLIGSVLMAGAIEQNNLHKRLAITILELVGSDPKMLILGCMIPTWFLSMWMSNSATTTMMITIADVLINKFDELDYGNVDDENPSLIDDIVLMNTLDINSCKSIDQTTSKGNVGSRASKLESNKILNTSKYNFGVALSLSIAYASSCGGLASITGTPCNAFVYEFLINRYGLKTGLNFGIWMAYALPISFIAVMSAWISLTFLFTKSRFSCSNKQTGGHKCCIGNIVAEEKKKLGVFTYSEGLCSILFLVLAFLWITKRMGNTGWQLFFESATSSNISDCVPAVFVGLLTIILPASNPIDIWREWRDVYYHKKQPDPTQIRTLLTWNEFQKRMPWSILILIGGGFAMADICIKSGLLKELGYFLGQHLKTFPSYALVLICTLTAAIVTEFMSNVAAISILLPIVISVSEHLGFHPFLLALPTTLGSSFAFCLPAATPPNAIVFSKGRIKVTHLLRAGIVLNILCVIVTVVATITYGQLIFGFDALPSWNLKHTNTTTIGV